MVHLGPLRDTAALGQQLLVTGLPVSPVVLQGSPLPLWPHSPCQGESVELQAQRWYARQDTKCVSFTLCAQDMAVLRL